MGIDEIDEVLLKLTKPVLSFDRLEERLLNELNRKFGTNCTSIIQFRNEVMKWCPADGLENENHETKT